MRATLADRDRFATCRARNRRPARPRPHRRTTRPQPAHHARPVRARRCAACRRAAARRRPDAACGGGQRREDSDRRLGAPAERGAAGPRPPSRGRRRRAGTGRPSGGGARRPPRRTRPGCCPSDRDVVYRGAITVRVTRRRPGRGPGRGAGHRGRRAWSSPSRPRPTRGTGGYGQATLTLRVPPTAFGPTLDALGRLGKELDRQRSAEDVTTQVTDVDSRVALPAAQRRPGPGAARPGPRRSARSSGRGRAVPPRGRPGVAARRSWPSSTTSPTWRRSRSPSSRRTGAPVAAGGRRRTSASWPACAAAGTRSSAIVLVALTVLGALLPFVLAPRWSASRCCVWRPAAAPTAPPAPADA